ncbi:MAG: hypothetical protein KIT11_05615 [Fimbriimonadaceae bacterium]|nr:hypothetical protein [Fimbriimonadaceae bacterium]QYK56629.1 MAG: hypothetical protein KF733_03900 [Fimbriimonadaceae bacterium]
MSANKGLVTACVKNVEGVRYLQGADVKGNQVSLKMLAIDRLQETKDGQTIVMARGDTRVVHLPDPYIHVYRLVFGGDPQ